MRIFGVDYLCKRGRIFYFRRAIPTHLVERFQRKEIKVSLRTRDEFTARICCREISNRFEKLMFRVARMPDLTKDKIDALLRGYFEGLLSKAEELAVMIPDDPDIDITFEIDDLQSNQIDFKKRIGKRDYDNATLLDAEELLTTNGYRIPRKGNEEFEIICNGILRARSEQSRILGAMLQGDYENTEPIDPLFKGVQFPGLPPVPGDKSSPSASTVSSVINGYCDLKSDHDWVPKTLDENKRILGWFADFVGPEKKIKGVTVDDCRDFRNALSKLPANFTKSKEFKGMSLREISQKAGDKPKLNVGTTRKYFGCVKWFLGWCEDEGEIASNPAQKIKVMGKVNQQDARHPFSKDQLIKLFQSPQYTGHRSANRRSSPGEALIKDGKFWVPVIGLFTGMRLGEIVQLLVSDVRQEDDISFFEVSKGEDDDKNLKTATSQRAIPIHPELVKMGFLDYVEGQRKKTPQGRIFSEIKVGANGYFSHNFSKWFGRYLKQVEVKTAKTSFHSFRHNFKDGLRNAGIEDSRQNALMGHSDGSVPSTYGTGYSPKVLNDDLQKIEYPSLDLSHLYVKDS